MKLKPDDLKKIADRMRPSTALREGGGRAKITVHMGTCGIASGAREIMKAFLKQTEEHDTTDVVFTTSGCAGLCSHEPMATVELKDEIPVKYVNLTEEKVQRIFKDHIIGGNAVADFSLVQDQERIG